MSISTLQASLNQIHQYPLPYTAGTLLISAIALGILASLGSYGVISLPATGCWVCGGCGVLMTSGALALVLLKRCRQTAPPLIESEPGVPSFSLVPFLVHHGIVQEQGERISKDPEGDHIKYDDIDRIYPPNYFYPDLTFEKTSFDPLRDRYENMLPFKHTRYQMKNTQFRKACPYINASLLPDGHILTQGPKAATFNDFWLMAWDSGISTIVMTTMLVESDKRKCDQYWPDINTAQQYGSLTVTCISDEEENGMREFEITNGIISKRVTQHYLKWEDNKAFSVEELHKIILKIKGSAIIHCSAGIGRTGTFAACLWIYKIFQSAQGWKIHLPKLVALLRTFRASLVFTASQYKMLRLYLEHLNILPLPQGNSLPA